MSAPKRFYKTVTTGAKDDGFAILLDNRPIKTPAGAFLIVPTQAAAELVAQEWRAQGDELDLPNMRLTRLSQTSIDRVVENIEPVAAELVNFGGNDLLCYRAEAPEALKVRQAHIWDPLLEWAATRHGAHLRAGEGITYVEQSPEALAALAEALKPHDAFRLSALHPLVSIFGSLVLALAVEEGVLDADAGFAAAHIDEAFQAEAWGVDEEAKLRSDNRLAEVREMAVFLQALSAKSPHIGTN